MGRRSLRCGAPSGFRGPCALLTARSALSDSRTTERSPMDIRLAITGAQLITASDPTPVAAGTILIAADGRIAAVGPSQAVPVPAGAPTLSAIGMTLLPGLIDGHVHITWDKTLYSAYSSKDYSTRLLLRD